MCLYLLVCRYRELSPSYTVCDSSNGEDPQCSDSLLVNLNVVDHVTYMGFDFVANFLACKLQVAQTEPNQTNDSNESADSSSEGEMKEDSSSVSIPAPAPTPTPTSTSLTPTPIAAKLPTIAYA